MSNLSLGWQKLQDVYYYLRPCYEQLNWPGSKNLYGNFKVEVSTQSTLLALSSKHIPYPSVIDVYSMSGRKVTSVIYNNQAADHIVDYTFRDEDLIVVLNSRKFRYYKDLKGNFNEYDFTNDLVLLNGAGDESPSISRGSSKNGSAPGTGTTEILDIENNVVETVYDVLEAKVWYKYLVLRLRSSFIITDLDTFTNYSILLRENFSKLHYYNILPSIGADDAITLLVAYDISLLTIKIDFSLQEFEVTDEGLTEGPFTEISTSPNGMLVSLYNSKDSKIFVINRKFDQVLLEYDTSNEIYKPYQVAWCGNDAIVLSLRDELKLIGPSQNSISFYYDLDEADEYDARDEIEDGMERSAIIPILKTESDGLKVITPTKIEFLSRVPESSINLYQIGSSSPSAILLDCIEKLAQHSPKADTNISLLKSDHSLELAMNECLQASLEEFQPVWQKKLLRVVSFGKVYCEPGSYDADEYTQTVGTLKVLNQIRYSDIGIFITYKELLQIGWEKIIDMLLRRDLHYLALKIIAIIKEDQYIDKVYIHWCCCKITKEMNMSDFELFKIIVEKLKNYSTSTTGRTKSHILKNFISVDEISDVSYQEGRLNLCKLLINLEPSILKKINSFINLGDLELALLKSFQSGDYDVCKLILLQLQEKLTPVQFFKILNQNEQKSTLVDTSLNEIDSDLKNFLHLSDDNKLFIHGDLISNFWLKAIGRFNPTLLNEYYRMEEKQPEVKAIIKETTKTANETTYYEDYKAKLIKIINSHSTSRKDVKVYESELQLLETQRKLSQTYQTDTFFQDKSPIAILIRLINLSQLKQASNISKDFKISKEKYWYLVLDTLTKNGEFEKLYQFILSQNNITTPANESTSDLRSPIGFKYIVDRCLAFRAPKAYISVFIKNCSNIHYTEKIDLFIKNKDLNLAALEAYRFKDIEFLHAIKDKANRESNSQVVSSINTYISRLGY